MLHSKRMRTMYALSHGHSRILGPGYNYAPDLLAATMSALQ